MDPRTRMLKLAQLLYAGQRITSRFVADHFGVSVATAKRDVTLIEKTLPVLCERSDRDGALVGLHERVLHLPKSVR
jgi:predicted DNA-binding transcriptional regulator YafY